MKKAILVLIAGLLLIGASVFAQDVSIDENGNLTTGSSNPIGGGNLDVTGASGEHAIRGVASGTGAAGVYGENGDVSGYGGYFQGNTKVTGDLTVDGTINNTGLNADTVDGKHSLDLLDKATYDSNADGKADNAENAVTAATASTAVSAANSDTVDNMHATELLDKATYDANANSKADYADDADMVDGMHAADVIAAAGSEVRTPISSCQTISNSGSYYVTNNISTFAGVCIQIDVSNVTIDLMGFTLNGNFGGGHGGTGINIDNSISNIEIKNGSITEFYYGIAGGNTHTVRVINVRVVSNTNYGINVSGSGVLIKDCTAAYNGWGIQVSDGSTISNNIVHNNTETGIIAANGSTVISNTSYNNQGYGISAGGGSTIINNTVRDNQNKGIVAGMGSTVTNNTVYGNQDTGISGQWSMTITNNTVYKNTQYGIYASSGSTISDNTVYWNEGDCGVCADGSSSTVSHNTVLSNSYWGISASAGTKVTNNTLRTNNGSQTAGYGGMYIDTDSIVKGNSLYNNFLNNIYVNGEDNVIEENLVTDSINGINFISAGNFYYNNRASGNTTDYTGSLPTGSGDGGGNVSF